MMMTRKSEARFIRYQVNILVSVLVLAQLTRVSARCDLTDVATVQGASEPSRVVGVERALVFASAPARRPARGRRSRDTTEKDEIRGGEFTRPPFQASGRRARGRTTERRRTCRSGRSGRSGPGRMRRP